MELERRGDDVQLHPEELALTFASPDEALQRLFAAFRPLAWAPRRPELEALAVPIIGAPAAGDAGAVQLRATYVVAVARRRSA